MLEQIIIGLLIVTIGLMLYFNLSKSDKDDFNIQSIKDDMLFFGTYFLNKISADSEGPGPGPSWSY